MARNSDIEKAVVKAVEKATLHVLAISGSTDGPMLSPRLLALRLGVGDETIRLWRRAGKLPEPDFQEGSTVRWKPSTIDRWMLERKSA